MMNLRSLPRLYTVQDIASGVGVHEQTIHRWKRGRFKKLLRPDIAFGNFVRWKRSSYARILRCLPNDKYPVKLSPAVKSK